MIKSLAIDCILKYRSREIVAFGTHRYYAMISMRNDLIVSMHSRSHRSRSMQADSIWRILTGFPCKRIISSDQAINWHMDNFCQGVLNSVFTLASVIRHVCAPVFNRWETFITSRTLRLLVQSALMAQRLVRATITSRSKVRFPHCSFLCFFLSYNIGQNRFQSLHIVSYRIVQNRDPFPKDR